MQKEVLWKPPGEESRPKQYLTFFFSIQEHALTSWVSCVKLHRVPANCMSCASCVSSFHIIVCVFPNK